MERNEGQDMDAAPENALALRDLCVSYGLASALNQVSLHVKIGEIATLLGPNGAGKTTTLKAAYGFIPIAGGEIYFFGKRVKEPNPHQLVGMGIGLVVEEKAVFAPMSVMDNLILGGYCRRGREKKKEREKNLAEVFNLFPILKIRMKQRAGTLSGGEQQMLALGRVLMSCPRLLLLDEPSLGLAPMIISQIMLAISELRDRAISVLLVEQNARSALRIADRGYVMEGGRILAEGAAEKMMKDQRVRSSYLGKRLKKTENA